MNETIIPVRLETDEALLSLDFGAVNVLHEGALPAYEGPYEVHPTWQNQTLATREKRMTDDLLIYDIPLSETSNDAGGLTLNIGG